MSRITEAIFRNGQEKKVLNPEEISKEVYNQIYKDHLFCPHPGCKAMLYYASGDVQMPHFRSYPPPGGNHIAGCPYEVDRSDVKKPKRKFDPNYKYGFSDEHISNVLNRAYLIYIKGVKKTPTNSNPQSTAPSPSLGTSETIETYGSGEFFSENPENIGREEKIPIRLVESLTDEDHGKKMCLVGKVSHVHIEPEFAYINYSLKFSSSGVRIMSAIRFGQRFIALNEAQFGYFPAVKDFTTALKDKGEDVYCCCVGELYKVKDRFNLQPDRYTAFSLNNKKLYAIVHEMDPNI